jgi:hypothetical protein
MAEEPNSNQIISIIIESVKTHFNLSTQHIIENINRLVKIIDLQGTDILNIQKKIIELEYENKNRQKEIEETKEKTDKQESFIEKINEKLTKSIDEIKKIAAKKFPLKYVISIIIAILSTPGILKLLDFIILALKSKIVIP